MILKLYSAKGSNSSERVEWVLNYKSVPYSRIEVSNEELISSYMDINPYGYVPCLEVEGHCISESMAIIECLEELFPEPSLLGESTWERASIREVCEFVNSSIHSPQNRTVLNTLRPELDDISKKQVRGQWITSRLNILSSKLCKQSQFAVGNHFSIADIFVASIYKKALQHGCDKLAFYDEHLVWLRSHCDIFISEP